LGSLTGDIKRKESMKDGNRYIKLWQSVFDSYVKPKKPYSNFEAWVYILMRANGTEKTWNGIKIERGSFVTSFKNLAEKWEWSWGRVWKYFGKLKEISMVITKSTNKYTVIKVINYSLYNPISSKSDNKRDSKSDNKVITKRYQSDTTNKDNKEKKDNRECIAPEFLERIKKKYPEFSLLRMDWELEKWKTWVLDLPEKKKPKNNQASFRNWCFRSIEFKEDRQPKMPERKIILMGSTQ